jgi:hypothetical protein
MRFDSVPDDGLEPALAESSARLLVGEDFLEADDLLREAGEARLRGVDHRQPFVEFGELLAGAFARSRDALADAGADLIQPLGDEAGEIALACPKRLGDRAHAARQLGVLAGEKSEGSLHLVLALIRLKRPLPRRAAHARRDEKQRRQRDRRGAEQQFRGRDRRSGEQEYDAIHAKAQVIRGADRNESRTFAAESSRAGDFGAASGLHELRPLRRRSDGPETFAGGHGGAGRSDAAMMNLLERPNRDCHRRGGGCEPAAWNRIEL